jgi:hypothetical protein
MEAWAGGVQERMQAAIEIAQEPQGLVECGVWLLRQLVTVNVAWVIVALAVGLMVAVGATEFSKRFNRLFAGENWALRAQLYAALWGVVVTSLLIWVLTDWPAHGRIIACATIAPLSAFYAHRAYDVLRRLFPVFMERASTKLRGDHNCDVTPP